MISDDLGWTALLVTVASLYLHRIAGADRFAIGVPVHNRSDARTRNLLGPVMEVFPVDVEVRDDDTYRSLHKRVARSLMSTLRHAVPGTAPAQSDVEAVVNVIPRAGMGDFGDVPATVTWVHPGASDPSHLFRLQLTPYGRALDLALDLNEGGTAPEQRRWAGHHVSALLADVLAEPDRVIGALDLRTPEERSLLDAWGTGADPGPAPVGVVEQLAAVLPATGTVVLEDGGRTWTGPELWAAAQRMAASLAGRGVGPSTRVGIELPRSAEAVVAILGTLIAGGSYVPLDPAQPEARRRRLAERAGCALVVDAAFDVLPGDSADPPCLCRPCRDPPTRRTCCSPRVPPASPRACPSPTGASRGTCSSPASAYLHEHEAPVVPLFSALTFDLTVTSLFLPLLTGGRTVDHPRGRARSHACPRRAHGPHVVQGHAVAPRTARAAPARGSTACAPWSWAARRSPPAWPTPSAPRCPACASSTSTAPPRPSSAA
jgi:non-ribosomal peptide synthetase component F